MVESAYTFPIYASSCKTGFCYLAIYFETIRGNYKFLISKKKPLGLNHTLFVSIKMSLQNVWKCNGGLREYKFNKK